MKQYTIDTPYSVGSVHCYTFKINGRHILIDTGPPTVRAKLYLKKHLPIETLDYVFITHCHADHYGLIDFIKSDTNAQIVISKYDAQRFQRQEERYLEIYKIFLEFGFKKSFVDKIADAINQMNNASPVPKDYLILEEIDSITKDLDISYVRCPGHSQSDIIYLLQGYAVSGDVLLKGIFQTPLLDINFDEKISKRFNNYDAFCDTLEKLKSIENYHFLPGHRENIGSVDERIVAYMQKMIKRSIKLKSYIGNQSIADIVLNLVSNYEKNPMNTFLKASEVAFIKDFIEKPDKMIKVLKKIKLIDQLNDGLETLFD